MGGDNQLVLTSNIQHMTHLLVVKTQITYDVTLSPFFSYLNGS